MVPGQLLPKKIGPRIIAPWMIAPRIIASQAIAPRQIVSWIIAPRTIAPEESCSHRKAHKILSSKSKLSIYLNFSRLVIFSMKFYTTIQPLSTDITFTIYLAVHWNNL